MEAAERIIELIGQEPMAAVLIIVVALMFTGLMKASQVAAELLVKRWLAPQPISSPEKEGASDEAEASTSDVKEEPASVAPLQKLSSWSQTRSLTASSFVLALTLGLIASVITAGFTGEFFEGQRADGQTCQGVRVFGIEIGPCSSEGTIEGIEGL